VWLNGAFVHVNAQWKVGTGVALYGLLSSVIVYMPMYFDVARALASFIQIFVCFLNVLFTRKNPETLYLHRIRDGTTIPKNTSVSRSFSLNSLVTLWKSQLPLGGELYILT
jgi:hypothetical protein